MDFEEGKKNLSEITSVFLSDLSKMRSGRASTDMLEGVQVDAYDSKMPISHVASVSIPDPKTIVVQPWDKGLVQNIEKAILASDIGFTPVVDGEIIRISIPALTQELREKFVREMKDRMEKAKIAVRSVRHQMLEYVESLSENGGISEDEIDRQKSVVEDEVKRVTEEIEKIGEDKEKELMTV
jgi:ribosome recycling factor